MHRVTKIITNDGSLFDTEKEAKHYLEVKYADYLCKLASRLVNIEKYQKMCEFLDENINKDIFLKVQNLKDEILQGITEEN